MNNTPKTSPGQSGSGNAAPSRPPVGQNPRDTAVRMLTMGLWPIPLYPPGVKRGTQTTAGKEPYGTGWGLKRNTPDTIREFFAKLPKGGIGVALGPGRGPGGSWLIDVEGDGPEAEASRERLFGGEVLRTLGWSSARGGHDLLLVDAERFGKLLSPLGALEGKGLSAGVYKLPEFPDLEIRTGGTKPDGTVKQIQSAFPPTVGTDGKPREWNGEGAIVEAPESLYEALERAAAATRSTEVIAPRPEEVPRRQRESPGDDIGRIREALSYLGNKAEPYDEWVQVGMALSELGQPGLELWEEWSSRSPKYNRAECEAKWKSFTPKAGVTLGSLIAWARSAGWRDPRERGANGRHHEGNGKAPREAVRVDPVQSAAADDDAPIGEAEWVSPPDPLVYHGLAGEVVRAIEPTTEADPLALLGQFLLTFGSIVGRNPYYEIEATRHYANEFLLIVAESASGRKGTSWERTRDVFRDVDPEWMRARIAGGLSSGEGLLNAVRDPVSKEEPVKDKGRVVRYETVTVDAGVTDKRLCVLESEFGGVLRANERDGSRLSAFIRNGWDSGNLSSMTKSPARATDAHISIIGHITGDELAERLAGSDISNGFANRFLWLAVRRSKILPFGGEGFDPRPFVEPLRNAVEAARGVGRVTMTNSARRLWEAVYEALSTPGPGTLGKVTNRAAPHVCRLALIYALLDGYGVIDEQHLVAGLKLWEASVRCAAHIFGDSTGDAKADKILGALKQAPAGMTRTEIYRNVFNGNQKTDVIKKALQSLMKNGAVSEVKDTDTGGGPRTVYRFRGSFGVFAANTSNTSLFRESLGGGHGGKEEREKERYVKDAKNVLTTKGEGKTKAFPPSKDVRTRSAAVRNNSPASDCPVCFRLDCPGCDTGQENT